MKKKIIASALTASLIGAIESFAATPAQYPGGMEALALELSNSIIYPSAAKDNGIEGTVTVSFTIDTDGSIINPRILRPIDPDLEAEALRVISQLPSWNPAINDEGIAIAQEVTVPVKFRLQ